MKGVATSIDLQSVSFEIQMISSALERTGCSKVFKMERPGPKVFEDTLPPCLCSTATCRVKKPTVFGVIVNQNIWSGGFQVNTGYK